MAKWQKFTLKTEVKETCLLWSFENSFGKKIKIEGIENK